MILSPDNSHVLKRWMRFVLIFGGFFNITAGLAMILFYHEGFKFLELPKPEVTLPVQVMGVLVALFGVGYLLVAHSPHENRHILTLGFLSKAICSLLALIDVAEGHLPLRFLPLVFFADIIYLPPFYIIMRRIYRQMAEARHN